MKMCVILLLLKRNMFIAHLKLFLQYQPAGAEMHRGREEGSLQLSNLLSVTNSKKQVDQAEFSLNLVTAPTLILILILILILTLILTLTLTLTKTAKCKSNPKPDPNPNPNPNQNHLG